jgi:long-chain fatty acid transport protein
MHEPKGIRVRTNIPCRLALAACVVLSPAVVAAQSSLQVPIQFDFINPGAKSLAVGGAFVGIADDATAVFANPAGLRELNRSEWSLELRGRRLDSPFLERGRLSGPIENVGLDTINGPVYTDYHDPNVSIAYLAYVYASPRRKWAISGFRHELARVQQDVVSIGVFQKDPAELASRRELPQTGERELSVTSYAAAAAIELTPHVSIGGTLNVYTFDLRSDFRRFLHDGFSGPPLLDQEVARATQEGDDVAVAPTLGLRACMKRCDDRTTASLRGGFVYRHGPSFEYETQSGSTLRTNAFRIPHVIAGGAVYELPLNGRRILMMVDVAHVTHSRLYEDFLVDQAVGTNIESNVYVDDGTEIHAGVQYTAETVRWRPRYRFGVWSDPDHSINYQVDSPGSTASRRVLDERMSASLAPGDRQFHVAGGLGLTMTPRAELNVGADFSSNAFTISTSLIFRMGQ